MIDAEMVRQLLDKVGLLHLADQRKQTIKEYMEGEVKFSAGENQRLDLARVLARKADVYLFDEPTANLDPLLGKKIIEELLTLFK